ncbi:hypothetical protein [Corynebacterium flavescens]|uniref:hypothetical protein n=1 Tax=Corynebacterium flavescens TaxID=28028 RepID=UPI00289ABC9C|nr:hypothetical protein [Corynebacterium flavescens]
MNNIALTSRQSDIQIIWLGVDGSRWILHGPGARSQGAWIETIKGILAPPSTLRTRAAARQRGSTPGTVKVDERLIDLTVHLTATPADPLPIVEERWNRAWSMDTDGKLWIITANSARWFSARPRENEDLDLTVDPRRRGVLTAEMTLVACEPDAHGHPEITDWTCNGPTTVTISNPTDLPAWPTFIVAPGLWELPDGIGGDVVALKPSPQAMSVQTRPGVEPVTLADGSPGYRLLGGQRFVYPIPPRTPPTEVIVSGVGALQIIIERRWRKGW